MAMMHASCFSKNGISSLLRSLRLISTFPVSFTPWTWKTDLAVSRPIMVMLMAGGSLFSGSFKPPFWTSMPIYLHLSGLVHAVDLEDRLGCVQANHGNAHGGRLLLCRF